MKGEGGGGKRSVLAVRHRKEKKDLHEMNKKKRGRRSVFCARTFLWDQDNFSFKEGKLVFPKKKETGRTVPLRRKRVGELRRRKSIGEREKA